MYLYLMVFLIRCLPNKQQGYTGGTFKTVVIANNLTLLSKEVTLNISGEDVATCKKFSRQKGNALNVLAKSLAPSIQGHEIVKQVSLFLLYAIFLHITYLRNIVISVY